MALTRGMKPRRAFDERGQMTVELAIVMPVALIIAVIAVNIMAFAVSCAEFDRVARNAARTYAAAPAYEQTLDGCAAAVDNALSEALGEPNIETKVVANGSTQGYMSLFMTMEYRPTLFGLGLKDEVFGVPLPAMEHSIALVVDTYRPGMLF